MKKRKNHNEKEFEIFFHDLKVECQRDFLEFAGIEKPENGNFDIFPLAIIPKGEDEEKSAKDFVRILPKG